MRLDPAIFAAVVAAGLGWGAVDADAVYRAGKAVAPKDISEEQVKKAGKPSKRKLLEAVRENALREVSRILFGYWPLLENDANVGIAHYRIPQMNFI